MSDTPTRRQLLTGAALGGGALLAGCDSLNRNPAVRDVLQSAEDANFAVQRALGDRAELAREYGREDVSADFRANGTIDPDGADYRASAAQGFADWRLEVGGLVDHPLSFSLNALREMPQRTQITRHDCVEGWSAIGEWTGVPLRDILDMAGVQSAARFAVFRCADTLRGTPYYESIDMIDARHPQTIMAHRLNGEPLPIKNGAPLRLRVERQLGYKHAKYVRGIELVESLAGIGQGKGGYWEDVGNYAWYAGI